MTCRGARKRFSALRDGALDGPQDLALRRHLEACASCAARWDSFREALDDLAKSPRLRPSDPVAASVRMRLEMEGRNPGLALLFRPGWAARPLILPSLVPAAFALVLVVGAAVFLDRTLSEETLPEVFVPSADVSMPRVTDESIPPEVLAAMGETSLFVETIVAGDGTVAAVTLIDGDRERAQPVLEALRRERFEPGRFRGFLPVTVSIYRLISLTEVRASIT
jgi:hypothetical protein